MDRIKKNSILGERKDILQFLDINSEDYYFFLDITKEIICFSDKIKSKISFMEWEGMECLLSDWEKNVYAQDRPQFRKEWEELKSGKKKQHSLEYRIMNWGGEVVWVNSSGKVELDSNGTPSWVFGRISENKLQDRADNFTGAFSTDAFREELSRILAEKRGGYFLLVGVDGLKSINMKNGWEFGDELLKLIVRYLEEITGAKRIYRVNGDCFAVNILKDSEEEISRMFSRLQQYLQGKCTLSAGCVPLLKYEVPDVGTLFQYAENSLDSAKAKGKNILSFFSAEDYEKNLGVLKLKEELTRSVKNGFEGFQLYYQPQMYADTLRLYGAEALLRYQSKSEGMISPSKFIPLLEETGLIHSVGIWILETALAQCKKWRKRQPYFHISINMSCSQLSRSDIGDIVADLVKRSGVPSECITIEVTESMSISADYQINSIFARWKKEGIRISMDDFGTGYSSLSRLSELDVDEIKIDRCFVKEIEKSVYNHRLIGNMIELAENRNIDICCEGVETLGELVALKELGPRFLQGYLFARPCVPEQFEQMYFGEDSKDSRKRLENINQTVFKKMALHNSPIDWMDEGFEKNVLDNLDSVVYVSDMETYELYYLNKAGKKALDIKNYAGKKCYKVLQGKDRPCEFCNSHLLNDKEFYIWERDNDYCGHRYYIKDRQININGKKLRLEIAVDIAKIEKFSKQSKECVKFAEQIGDCARTLAFERDENKAAQIILQMIASQCGADRVYILKRESDNKWIQGCEWKSDEQMSTCKDSVKRAVYLIQNRLNELRADHLIFYPEYDQGEEGTVPDKQRPELIVIPLFKRGDIVAVLGIDTPKSWTAYDAYLKTYANLLSNAICNDKNNLTLRYPKQRVEKNILDLLNVGLWMIRYKEDTKEMFIDNTMYYVLGAPDSSDPQENYAYWYNRICNGYYQYVDDSIHRMIESWQIVQLEYTWEHPKKGEVVVRCTGVRIPDQNGYICLKGYHRIISDIDKKSSLETDSTKIVFEYNETSKTAFFHRGGELVGGGVVKETDFPQCWIDRKIVPTQYIWRFYKYFSLLRMKERFEELEVPLKFSNGDYEWYVITSRHLSKAEKDLDTVVVTIEPFGEYRRLQMQYHRTKLFYQTVLSETIAHAELELESGRITDVGGLWKAYKQEYRKFSGNSMDFIIKELSSYLCKEDVLWLKKFSSEKQRKEMINTNLYKRFVYQRVIKGKLSWVELVCHVFKEDSSHATYILMYLKDINNQKEREMKQTKAAMEDDLTHVLNHTSFQEKVTQYVISDSQEVNGAFVLFDVDNFKLINDNKGHLAGDQALKIFVEILKNSFEKEDIIGRLGGDEFAVFAKGIQKQEEIERKIRHTLDEVKKHISIQTSCSAGVCFVNKNNFNYTDYLHKADIALYRTKKSGKDGISYYTEMI